MLSPEEIQQIVTESGSRIRAKIIEGIDSRVASAIEQQLRDAIGAEVQKFVADEVLPELREQLIGEKPKLIAAAAAAASAIADAMTRTMVAKAEKTLSESSYSSGEILKKLFGGF